MFDTGDFSTHLPLHIINGTAGSISVGAVVLVVNLLDGMIHLVFNLKQKHSSWCCYCFLTASVFFKFLSLLFYIIYEEAFFHNLIKSHLQSRPQGNPPKGLVTH